MADLGTAFTVISGAFAIVDFLGSTFFQIFLPYVRFVGRTIYLSPYYGVAVSILLNLFVRDTWCVYRLEYCIWETIVLAKTTASRSSINVP